jgi:hypothetical protein
MSMQSVSLVKCSLGGVVFMSLLLFQILNKQLNLFSKSWNARCDSMKLKDEEVDTECRQQHLEEEARQGVNLTICNMEIVVIVQVVVQIKLQILPLIHLCRWFFFL